MTVCKIPEGCLLMYRLHDYLKTLKQSSSVIRIEKFQCIQNTISKDIHLRFLTDIGTPLAPFPPPSTPHMKGEWGSLGTPKANSGHCLISPVYNFVCKEMSFQVSSKTKQLNVNRNGATSNMFFTKTISTSPKSLKYLYLTGICRTKGININLQMQIVLN